MVPRSSCLPLKRWRMPPSPPLAHRSASFRRAPTTPAHHPYAMNPVAAAANATQAAAAALGIGLGGAGYLLVYYVGVLRRCCAWAPSAGARGRRAPRAAPSPRPASTAATTWRGSTSRRCSSLSGELPPAGPRAKPATSKARAYQLISPHLAAAALGWRGSCAAAAPGTRPASCETASAPRRSRAASGAASTHSWQSRRRAAAGAADGGGRLSWSAASARTMTW
jgi:hypothetical protein